MLLTYINPTITTSKQSLRHLFNYKLSPIILLKPFESLILQLLFAKI
jgi:hypothetical protein